MRLADSHGAKDRDAGYESDIAAPWGVSHHGNYDLPEMFECLDDICRK